MNERDIFLSALEIEDPAARQAHVQSACAGDADLMPSVEALLASHGQSQFLNTPVVEQMAESDSAATMLIGKGSTTDEEYPHTEFLSHGANSMNRTESDDENQLGYLLGFLQPSSRPDSKGRLSIGKNVTDLSPLKGASLRRLTCAGARNLTDLAPLKGMSLRYINLYFTQVSDLSPLKGMPLEHVIIAETNVTDLGLLKEMSTLKILNCGRSITDLSPLKGLALEELHGDFQPARDGEILRSIKTLKKINDKPAGEFWMGGEK